MMASGLLYALYTSPSRGWWVKEGATCVGTKSRSASGSRSYSSGVQHMMRVMGPGCPARLWLKNMPAQGGAGAAPLSASAACGQGSSGRVQPVGACLKCAFGGLIGSTYGSMTPTHNQ